MRIVSLIASATEMIHALGLGEYQVGRSHECDFPQSIQALPVCSRPRFAVDGSSAEIDRLVRETLRDAGSVYEVFEDVLLQLEPTHILTQTQCRVCAVTLAEVEHAMSERFPTRPTIVALEPDSLAEIWNDIRRTASACHVPERGHQLIQQLQSRMKVIADQARQSARQPRVAVIEWIEPLMPAAHWTPELVRLLGAEYVAPHEHPDVTIVAPCGFDIPRTRTEMQPIAHLTGPIYLGDGNAYFNRPGPRVVETLQIIAAAAYPEIFPPVPGLERYQ